MWYKISGHIIAMFCALSVLGQTDTLVSEQDSVVIPKEKKWKLLAGFDANRSFFAGRPVTINGLRLGAKYKEVHRFGIGFYALKRGVFFTDIDVDKEDATDTSYVQFNVGFASLFYEYAFFRSKRWELAVPTYLGAGDVSATYSDTAGLYQPLRTSPFVATGTGVVAQFKIIRWFGLKAGVGYRLVFNEEKAIRKAFRGPYYKFGVSIFFGDLYNSLFRRERLEPW